MIVAEPGVTGAYGFQHVPAFYLPPVVTGSVILIIGIALLPVAANDIVDGCTTLALRDPVLLENVAQAMGMLLLIVVIQRVLRGFLGTVVVLSGLVIGTSVAWVLGDARLITAGETTGDVYATGEIVGKRIKRADIAAALRADGPATTIGGAGNSFSHTCFAENVGLVRLTQVRSRWVIAAAIPHPVLGGAAPAMFAAVAVVGIQTLGKVDFNDHRNIIVVGTSVGPAAVVTAQLFVAGASIALRTALHDALLSGSEGEQSELLSSFADLGTECDDAYTRDHEATGMSSLDEETHADVRELVVAYREHFGFPLIVSARDAADRYARVLSAGWARMANSRAVERGAALIEIASISNHRFDDRVADANPIASEGCASSSSTGRAGVRLAELNALPLGRRRAHSAYHSASGQPDLPRELRYSTWSGCAAIDLATRNVGEGGGSFGAATSPWPARHTTPRMSSRVMPAVHGRCPSRGLLLGSNTALNSRSPAFVHRRYHVCHPDSYRLPWRWSMSSSRQPDDRVAVEVSRYEPNPKHKSIPTPGRQGSLCPRDANGSALLAESSLLDQKRYATDGQHAYCAQQHAPNAWHGYPVDWQEVPPRVVAEWVAAGKVSRRTIRQARRRSDR